jgi:Zn-dependent M28 family amino/carboxypeptidase
MNTSCLSAGFDGQNALNYIETQVAIGPRIPGSENSQVFQQFLTSELSTLGWIVEKQGFSYGGKHLTNIIAKNSDEPPTVILGTHYDTRALSDRDPIESFRTTPVPGANDGASGTAVLLELAQHLSSYPESIWLVFFDAEDQGHIDNWEWSVGAQYFADQLNAYPDEVIIIDMIGDSDLNIYFEKNSSLEISDKIWSIAEELGFDDHFIPEDKFSIIDDHLPFINKGVPAALIIDLDYTYWHTTQDDLEHVSAGSLEIVGKVLLEYLVRKSVN